MIKDREQKTEDRGQRTKNGKKLTSDFSLLSSGAWRWGLLLLIFLLYLPKSAFGEDIRVGAAVGSQEVYVGEPFLFQVQIEGNDRPGKPDLSALSGNFFVEEQGGQQNSSTSITIINGRMQRVVKKGYVFSYRLTPRRAGTLKIPPLPVKVGRTVFNTQPLSINALPPEKSEDFKLRMSLSKEKAYVGEPLILKITWYIGKNVKKFQFNVPFLQDNPDFEFTSPQVKLDQSKKYFKIPVDGKEIIAQQGQGIFKGRSFTTLSFAKVVIPKRSGTFELSQAQVFCQVQEGYREHRQGFFNFDEDLFNFGPEKVYKKYVVPSNTLSLTVLPLPAEGRPPNFTGLVGKYHIVTSAVPTEVKVGDPITLTMKISGPSYLQGIPSPDLNRQEEFQSRFKVPKEISAGKVEDKVKVFTQTIRARNEKVTEIPPVEISYFNPETGRYEIARSRPIPLIVHRTKVITIANAEGIGGMPAKSKPENLPGGIAYNYEGLDVLKDQGFNPSALFRSWSWLGVLFGPMVFYLICLLAVRRRNRAKSDISGQRKKSAYRKISRGFKKVKNLINDEPRYYEELIKEVRNYLADKFNIPAAGLIFSEVERRLSNNGVDEETVRRLKRPLRELRELTGSQRRTSPHRPGGYETSGEMVMIKLINYKLQVTS